MWTLKLVLSDGLVVRATMKSEAILDQSVPDLRQGIDQLRDELAVFRYSLFRLETLQKLLR